LYDPALQSKGQFEVRVPVPGPVYDLQYVVWPFAQSVQTRSAVTVQTELTYLPFAQLPVVQGVHDAWPPLEV
jgi:hypothetical protein